MVSKYLSKSESSGFCQLSVPIQQVPDIVRHLFST